MDRAEGDVFFAAIGSVSPLTLLGTLLQNLGPLGALKLALDRGRMMQGAAVQAPRGEAARALLTSFRDDLEQRLQGQDFLGGAQPTIVDVTAFHPLWLHVSSRRRPLGDRHPRVAGWYERLEALGHGQREELEPALAFEAARSAKPRALPGAPDTSDERIGSRVSVVPADYGTVPVSGTLVALTPTRCILARDTERFGTLHVHFPLRGYALSPA